VVLLAQSEGGWRNLMKLASCAYLGAAGDVQVGMDDLERHAEGPDLPHGGPDGRSAGCCGKGHAPRPRSGWARWRRTSRTGLYVELQRHPVDGGLPEAERLTERGAVELAYDLGLPLVATNDVYFPKEDLFEAHDALLCIAGGAYMDQAEPRRRLTPQHFFKTPKQMAALFATSPRRWRTPSRSRGAAPSGWRSASRSCRASPTTRWRSCAGRPARASPRASRSSPTRARGDLRGALAYELGVIEQMGFPGYFLIVADFIKWAKAGGHPRGARPRLGAGSSSPTR
jgi:DNA polymerase-3 subunit alpha